MDEGVTAEASARGRRNRTHGHETERMVAKWLRANGYPDAATTRQKMGRDGNRTPGDISFHPLVILEVKSKAGSSWPSWCRQAAAEAKPGMVPVVVRRTRGVGDVGLWECRYDVAMWATAAHNLHPYGVPVYIDGRDWLMTDFAAFVAALSRFDALDGAR